MSTCPPPEAEVHPTDPEPIGPLAEKFLDDLAARQREALNRLRRQAQPKEPR